MNDAVKIVRNSYMEIESKFDEAINLVIIHVWNVISKAMWRPDADIAQNSTKRERRNIFAFERMYIDSFNAFQCQCECSDFLEIIKISTIIDV